MDGSKKFVGKWTRLQCQKAEEELLKKAKMLKEQKERRKSGSSSEKPMSKNGDNEVSNSCNDNVEILKDNRDDDEEEEVICCSSSDGIEILDEVFILHSKRRRQVQKSRISKPCRGISVAKKIKVTPCPESKDSKKNSQRRGDKNSVTLSRSNSLSSSREDRSSSSVKESNSGKGPGVHQDNKVEENCNQGSGSDQCDSEGEESQNQEKNMENDDSSEEEDGDESDDDYNVDESSKSESDDSAATAKRNHIRENREDGEVDLQNKKNIPASSFDMVDDCGNRNDDEEVRGKRRSQQREKLAKHSSSRDEDLMNILLDSIWEEGDALKEMLPPSKESVRCNDSSYSLPLKFRFEDEDDEPSPMEMDEEEKEIQGLFAALEMGWIQDDIGSTKPFKVRMISVIRLFPEIWFSFAFLSTICRKIMIKMLKIQRRGIQQKVVNWGIIS